MRRSDGFGRVLAWTIVLLATLVTMAVPARAYDGDWVIIDTGEGVPSESTPEENGETGYWELIEVYDTESDNYADEPHEGYLLEGSASGSFHAKYTITQDGYRFSYTNLDERAHNGTSCKGEYGETRTTFSPLPKSRLVAGDELAMTATVACATSAHKVGLNSQVTVRFMPEPTSGSYIYFKNASDGYVVAPDSEWVTEGERSGGYSCYDVDTSDVYSALVPDGAASWGDELYIRFDCTVSSYTISTFFHYGWEEGKPASEGVEVTGEVGRNGTPDQTTNPEGRQDLVIDTDASHDPGAFSKVLIPAAIVVGAGVAVGAYVSKKRKGNKSPSNKSTPNKKDEQKQQSSYIMVLEKDFGNELRAGGKPREVKARIEERMPEFETNRWIVRKRADLTQRIASYGVQNIEVISTRFQPPNMVATLRVPATAAKLKGDARRATVAFRYTGAGGTLTNNVTFKLAPEPALFYVEEPKGVCSRLFNSMVVALIGDVSEGSVFYFAAENFMERPDVPEIRATDSNIHVTCESYEDKRLPNLYVYKAVVTNTIPCSSPYGLWPLEHKLHITVKNDFGEWVEDCLALRLWPEGISLDTGAIKPERVRNDSVVVDTSDILLSAGTTLNIEGATLEVAVAYKDSEGNVKVTRPTEPSDGGYLSLMGVDDASDEVLNPKGTGRAPRIWYTLSYQKKSSYTAYARRGTLTLTPLMPAVAKAPEAEYRGFLELAFVDDGHRFEEKARFDVKAISSIMNDADVAEERARIKKIIKAFKLEDWNRVAGVLRAHGPAAERDLQRLGTSEDLSQAGTTAEELMALVDQIQSLHRLRAIRKLVYEACDLTVAHDKIDSDTDAETYGYLYNAAITVRWANDIAFTCWCYAFMGPNAAYAVPFISPLRTWLEDVLALSASCMWDSEMAKELEKQFSWEKLSEILAKCLEDELMATIVGALSSGGTSLIKDPTTYKALGAAYCFFFFKNLSKNNYEIWDTLKDATVDCSIFAIKALVSIVIARKFSKLEPAQPKKEDFISPSEDVFSYDGLNPVEAAIAKSFSWMTRQIEKSVCIGVNGVMRLAEGADNIVEHMVSRGSVNMWLQILNNQKVLGKDAQCEIWAAFYDAAAQAGLAGAGGFVEWALSLGTVPINLRDEMGKLKRIDMPLVSFVAFWFDWVFEYLEIGKDLSLPDLASDPDYYEHSDLVDKMSNIEGAEREVAFLLDPQGAGTKP